MPLFSKLMSLRKDKDKDKDKDKKTQSVLNESSTVSKPKPAPVNAGLRFAIASQAVSGTGQNSAALRETLQMLETSLGATHLNTLEAMNSLALQLGNEGQFQEAEMLHRQALDRWERVVGAEDPRTLMCLNNLGLLLGNQGRCQEAEELHKKTLEARKRVLGTEHRDTLVSMNNLALAYGGLGKNPEAEQLHRQTLELKKKVLGADDPSTLNSMNNLAGVLRDRGKLADAEALHREELQQCSNKLGPEHADTLVSMSNLAVVLRDEGKFREAELTLDKAVKGCTKVFGDAHPATVANMNNLANVLERQGKDEQAVQMYRKVLALNEKSLGRDHPFTKLARSNLESALNIARYMAKPKKPTASHSKPGELVDLNEHIAKLVAQGNYAAVEKILKQLVEVYRRERGPKHHNTVMVMNSLAVIYNEQRKFALAETMFRQVLELRREMLGPEHSVTIQCADDLALALFNQGQFVAAIALCREVVELKTKTLGPEHPGTVASKSNLELISERQKIGYLLHNGREHNGQGATAGPILWHGSRINLKVSKPFRQPAENALEELFRQPFGEPFRQQFNSAGPRPHKKTRPPAKYPLLAKPLKKPRKGGHRARKTGQELCSWTRPPAEISRVFFKAHFSSGSTLRPARRNVEYVPRTQTLQESIWEPESFYNPFGVMHVFPTLSDTLGDIRDESPVRVRWLQKKADEGLQNEVMDRVLAMYGLHTFKQHCFDLYSEIIRLPESERHAFNTAHSDTPLHISLVGSVGTGKSIAALRYWELLKSLDVLPKSATTIHHAGPEAASIEAAERLLREANPSSGSNRQGVVVVYHANGGEDWASAFGKLALLANRAQRNSEHCCYVCIGIATRADSSETTETTETTETSLYRDLRVAEFSETELRHGLFFLLGNGRNTRVYVEGGPDGPVMQDLLEIIQQGRQSVGGWENWTTLEKCARLIRGQRIQAYTRTHVAEAAYDPRGMEEAGRTYTRSELLGETAADVARRVPEYRQLEAMVGLRQAKAAVRAVAESARIDYVRSLQGRPLLGAELHMCFVGPPGTGKRTVARLYARMLWRLGLVNDHKITTVSVSDVMMQGSAAAARSRAQDTLDSSTPVTVIEDVTASTTTTAATAAYAFSAEDGVITGRDGGQHEHSLGNDGEEDDNETSSDDWSESIAKSLQQRPSVAARHAFFDALAMGLQERRKENRRPRAVSPNSTAHVVILIGSSDSIAGLFQRTKQGLALKQIFASELQQIAFHPYSTDELVQILKARLADDTGKDGGMSIDDLNTEKILREVLDIERLRPSFNNVRFIDALLQQAKMRYAARVSLSSLSADASDSLVTVDSGKLLPSDLDPRLLPAAEQNQAVGVRGADAPGSQLDMGELFHGLYGVDNITKAFRGYYTMATALRKKGTDPRPYVPMAFVFRGLPGTGKTVVAHNFVARLYYDMGFLDTADVVERSISDLVSWPTEDTATARTHVYSTSADSATGFGFGLGPSGLGKKHQLVEQQYRMRVTHVLTQATGKVLLINNKRRDSNMKNNANDPRAGGFSQPQKGEAELVSQKVLGCMAQCLTDARFAQKLVVVVEEDEGNDGTESEEGNRGNGELSTAYERYFTTVLPFSAPSVNQMLVGLMDQLSRVDINLPMRALQDDSGEYGPARQALQLLAGRQSWASWWDVDELAKVIVQRVYSEDTPSDSEQEGEAQPTKPTKLRGETLLAVLKSRLARAR